MSAGRRDALARFTRRHPGQSGRGPSRRSTLVPVNAMPLRALRVEIDTSIASAGPERYSASLMDRIWRKGNVPFVLQR
jgi:hypothetical protein